MKNKPMEEITSVVFGDHTGADRDLLKWRCVFDDVNLARDVTRQLDTLNFTQVGARSTCFS